MSLDKLKNYVIVYLRNITNMDSDKVKQILAKNHYEYVDIDKLKPATYNPRKISEEAYNYLKESIINFGIVEPIVINKDFTIIGGHQRYKVMKELGFKKVYCSIVDVDKNTEKEMNITLNNEKAQGEWDFKLRQELLKEIKLEDEAGFELLGMKDLEIVDFNQDLNELENEFENYLETSSNAEMIKLIGDKESIATLKQILNNERKNFPEYNDVQLILNKLKMI